MDKEQLTDNQDDKKYARNAACHIAHLNEKFKKLLGISYEKFDALDCDEQQRLMEKHRRKNRFKSKNETVMIGSGEHAAFINKKRGEGYMLFDGTIVRAGDSPEKSRARLEDRYDDLMYSKPVAFVKKLTRRIKNR